ncbi:MAG TPA: hypothetical protein VF548_13145 [Allosphingosinicella sp.]|jgi:hypothetical protein
MISERTDHDETGEDDIGTGTDPLDSLSPVFMYVHYLTGHGDEHGGEERREAGERGTQLYPLYLFQLEGKRSWEDHLKQAIDAILEDSVKEVPEDDAGQQHWRVHSYTAFVLNSDEKILGVELDYKGGNHSFDKVGEIPEYNGCSAYCYVNNRLLHTPRRRLRSGDSETFEWKVHHHNEPFPVHESSTTNTGP